MSAVLQSPLATPTTTLEIKPLAGRIGALIQGVRLSGDLAPETFAAIHQALLRHKVAAASAAACSSSLSSARRAT